MEEANTLRQRTTKSQEVELNDEVKTESTSPPNTAGPATSTKEEEDKNVDSPFECNICLDIASDAVISLCGHLFW